jgi:Spy/CpxP family protein refolding chaperone
MSAFHPARTTRLVVSIALLATVAAAVMAPATPVFAITCDDVRGLTHAEKSFWSKRLNLTPEQRHRIRVECYGPGGAPHVIETNGDSFKPQTNPR